MVQVACTVPTRRWVYPIIILAILSAHGLLLVNRATFWDDWLVKGFLDDGNWILLRNMTSEMGLPILAYFFGLLKLLGLSGYAKIVALVLILGLAILVYEIGMRCSFISHREALAIAVLSAIYPAFQTAVLLTTLQYLFFYFLFLSAVLLHICAEVDDGPATRKRLMRCIGAVTFFVSFNLNSLLVFYFPFLALIFVTVKERKCLTWRELARHVLFDKYYLILLPFLYWGVKKFVFPSYGLYETYNIIDLNPIAMIERMRYSVEVATLYHWHQSALTLIKYPYLWLLAIVLVAAFSITAARLRTSTSGHASISSTGSLTLLLCGFLLLISGIFPYAAAAIVPGKSGWNSRHALLYGLPVAVMIVGVSRCLCLSRSSAGSRTSHRLGFLRAQVLTLIALAFVLSSIGYYIEWQARAIKDQAIMDQLRSENELSEYSIYWVDDKFQAGGEPYYNYYEWSSMFKKIWGGQTRIAMQLKYQGRPISHDLPPPAVFTERYNLRDFDPTGPQTCLIVEPGYPDMSQARLVLNYFRFRIKEMFSENGEKSAADDFGRRSVRVRAKPLSDAEKKADPVISCGEPVKASQL